MSAYALRQTRRFARTYKKLHDNVASDVDAAALAVADKGRDYSKAFPKIVVE